MSNITALICAGAILVFGAFNAFQSNEVLLGAALVVGAILIGGLGIYNWVLMLVTLRKEDS